jgi:hypothetical protein
MKNNHHAMLFLFITLILILAVPLFFQFQLQKEGFRSYLNLDNPDVYPGSEDVPILTGDYKYTGSKTVSDRNYSDGWWKYPVFKVGSYAQITNNLRYWRNPDDAQCAPAEMCDALYENKKVDSNISHPLPPVGDSPGTRVNYYRTPENLFLGPQPGPALELPAF